MGTPIRLLELRSVRGTGGGPEKTILLSAAMSDPSRCRVTVCYLRDLRDEVFSIDERARELGVDYVEARERHSLDVSVLSQLRKLVRERAIDLVHAHDYKTNLYALLLARLEGCAIISTAHGYTGQSRKERLYYAADRQLLRLFPLVIVVSEDLRQVLTRAGVRPERIVRVLNGIDSDRFFFQPEVRQQVRAGLGLSDDDVVIGSVGRLERQKRYDLLLHAFATLARTPGAQSLKLVIAGDGSLRSELEQLSRTLHLEGKCRLLGHRTDVAELYHAFDLFVQTSDYEGTPNCVLEAMAFEVPIVATDAGGTREIITHGQHGVVIDAGDVATIAAAMRNVLGDLDGARQRASAARRRVETELSFRTRLAHVEQLYQNVLAGAARV